MLLKIVWLIIIIMMFYASYLLVHNICKEISVKVYDLDVEPLSRNKKLILFGRGIGLIALWVLFIFYSPHSLEYTLEVLNYLYFWI